MHQKKITQPLHTFQKLSLEDLIYKAEISNESNIFFRVNEITKKIYLYIAQTRPTIIKEISWELRTKEICDVAFSYDANLIKEIPKEYISKKMSLKALQKDIGLIEYIPTKYLTEEFFVKMKLTTSKVLSFSNDDARFMTINESEYLRPLKEPMWSFIQKYISEDSIEERLESESTTKHYCIKHHDSETIRKISGDSLYYDFIKADASVVFSGKILPAGPLFLVVSCLDTCSKVNFSLASKNLYKDIVILHIPSMLIEDGVKRAGKVYVLKIELPETSSDILSLLIEEEPIKELESDLPGSDCFKGYD